MKIATMACEVMAYFRPKSRVRRFELGGQLWGQRCSSLSRCSMTAWGTSEKDLGYDIKDGALDLGEI